MRYSALFLSLLACQSQTPTQTKVEAVNAHRALHDLVIGEVLPLTGPEATFGFAARDGVDLAVRQINAAGGVAGRKISVRVQDDRSRAEEATVAFSRIADREKPVAVIGSIASSNTLAIAPLAQQRKIPLITPASTSRTVTEQGEYIFRACFRDDFQGRVMAIFATQDLKAKTAAILRDKKSDYSIGLADEFSKAFKEFGGEIKGDEAFLAGEVHFKAQLTKLRESKPEVLFIPAYYTEAGLIVRQARELGLTAKLLGGDGWDSPRLAEIAGAAAEGAYFTTHFAPDADTEQVKRFVGDFKDTFGYSPDGLAAMGYESARLVIDALKRAESQDGAGVKAALAKTAKFPGLSGELSMGEARDPQKPAFVLKIDGGVYKFAALIR